MTYKVTDIQKETQDFFVLSVKEGYQVLRKELTHSVVVGKYYTKDPNKLRYYQGLAFKNCDERQAKVDRDWKFQPGTRMKKA